MPDTDNHKSTTNGKELANSNTEQQSQPVIADREIESFTTEKRTPITLKSSEPTTTEQFVLQLETATIETTTGLVQFATAKTMHAMPFKRPCFTD